MPAIALALGFLACAGHGLRTQQPQSNSCLTSLAKLLTTVQQPTAAWQAAGSGLPSHHRYPQSALRHARRAGTVKLDGLLQAFDLMPLMGCFKEVDVDACLEKVDPWLFVDQNGQMTISDAAKAGLQGGTIATLGAISTFLFRKSEIKDRLKCIYCEGSGQITCGRCAGQSAAGCETCSSAGTVVCINCQGSGRAIPEDLFRRLGDSEQGFNEDDLIGLFDELPAKSQLATTTTNKATLPAAPDAD